VDRIQTHGTITVNYKSDLGRSRHLYRVFCPSCNGEFFFRKYKIPSIDWMCRTCNGLVTVSCGNCGKEIEKQKSKCRSKSGLLFCNRLCKEQQQTNTGKLKLTHYSHERKDYRKSAIVAYGQRCNVCGISETYLLVVHHKDGNRKNGNIDNLEVLCHNHHAEKHKKQLANGDWVLDYKMFMGD